MNFRKYFIGADYTFHLWIYWKSRLGTWSHIFMFEKKIDFNFFFLFQCSLNSIYFIDI